MENKTIIGYKLIKPEYLKAITKITGGGVLEDSDKILTEDTYPQSLKDLKKAGVLDLWFSPVFENQFKVGDSVIVQNYTNIYNGKVLTIKAIRDNYAWFTSDKFEGPNFELNMIERLATSEEVQKAQIQLPIINGYSGKYENDFIIYGSNCAKFHKAFFEQILEASDFNFSEGTRSIKSIKLNTNIEISITEIKQIVDYINFKDNND